MVSHMTYNTTADMSAGLMHVTKVTYVTYVTYVRGKWHSSTKKQGYQNKIWVNSQKTRQTLIYVSHLSHMHQPADMSAAVL